MEQTREDFIRELAAEVGHNGGSETKVVSEPLTYRSSQEGGTHSYFRDRLMMSKGDEDAAARIYRHGHEMEALGMESRSLPADMETRINPSRTDGKGGYFTPPRWLIDQATTASRPNRTVSMLVQQFPLPPGASEISLPALTLGTKIEPEADVTTDASQDITDSRVSSPVVSIAGQQDVAIQWLEQAPPGAHVDAFLFKDMAEAYDANLEEQIATGTTSTEGGPYYQFTGLLNLEGINKITYTDPTPTGTKLVPELGKALAAIGKKRRQPGEAWFMTTARWAWLCTQEDSANRPLILACNNDAHSFPVGSLFGLPVYLDDALPVNRGAALNQDVIICCRPEDFILLESEPKLAVMHDVLSGTLQVRLVMNRYAAFLGGRYPTGIAVIEGTGMIPASGF